MITAIVEGFGDDLGLSSLVSSLRPGVEINCVPMGGKSNIVREVNGFEKTILRQRALGHQQFLVLMDGDVFFPPYTNIQDENQGMATRAQRVTVDQGVTVDVFWAIKTFESWLIGGLRSNQGVCGLRRKLRRIPFNTEVEPIDPVAWLDQQMKRGSYGPKTQGCLAKCFAIPEARNRNVSLDLFCTAFVQ